MDSYSSGYNWGNRGYSRTFFPGRRQGGPGCPDSGVPDERESFAQGKSKGYGRQPLRQRTPQHYPAYPHTHEQKPWHERTGTAVLVQDEIRTAFGYLQPHPQRALDAAEGLLDSRRAQQPSLFFQVVLLKTRALFHLNRIDDCIAFIDCQGTRMRNERSLLLAKARALQAKGCFSEALPLFQHLYANYRATDKDHKTYGLSLVRNLQSLGGSDNRDKALAILTRLRTRAAGGRVGTPCNDKEIELALGRHRQFMGGEDNLQQALAIFTRLRTRAAAGRQDTPCEDKDIELALGRCLQCMGGINNLEKALAIYTRLRTQAAGGRVNTPCNDKDIELTLGRHLQIMDGQDHLQQALAIYTRLRTRAAGGRANIPCDDKEIELALGICLQRMGGPENMEKARIIYTRLRARAAGGWVNTPCNDKDIELILARHLQIRGGADNMEKALAIYTRLRASRAGARANTPCDDKDIELTLGKHFALMGGKDNLEQALAIFTRLHTRAAGGLDHTPGDDKDIELALAAFFTERGNWPEFDQLRLEARRFPGFEPHLCLSVRYLRELLGAKNIACVHSRLLGNAIRSGVIAMEKSGFVNASCLSQLAHCIRVLSCWPDVLLQERGIQRQDVRRLNSAAKFLFNMAERIAPCRQRMEKDQHWREQEKELRALLLRQHKARAQPL